MAQMPLNISSLSDCGKDLRIVTRNGVVWTQKLLLAAVSRFLSTLLLGRDFCRSLVIVFFIDFLLAIVIILRLVHV